LANRPRSRFFCRPMRSRSVMSCHGFHKQKAALIA
jgi:hypothetical protein